MASRLFYESAYIFLSFQHNENGFIHLTFPLFYGKMEREVKKLWKRLQWKRFQLDLAIRLWLSSILLMKTLTCFHDEWKRFHYPRFFFMTSVSAYTFLMTNENAFTILVQFSWWWKRLHVTFFPILSEKMS